MRTIILITNSFPFGIKEKSFIAPELDILKEKFNIVIVARNVKDEQMTELSDNIKVFRYNSRKNYSPVKLMLRALKDKDFYKEILNCIKMKCISIKNIKMALSLMMRSIHFADYLKTIRVKYNEDVLYYTYWNDYATYSCTRIKGQDKIVSRIHRVDLYLLPNNNHYLAYKKLTNDNIDRLIFISNEGLQYYKDTFENYPEKLKLHYLGVKKQDQKAPYTNSSVLRMLSFSYLSPVKRVDLIIDTLSQIDDIEVEWTHIGGGVLEEKLRKYAKEKLSEKENISYSFTGYMKNEDAIEFVSQKEVDFLLNVSYSEGLPVTMMEAMSLGIPVIATDVGGVNEIVEDGNNGFLIIRDFKTEHLKELIIKYCKLSDEEKQSMRVNAYNTWESNFFDKKNYKGFVSELERLCQY